MKSFSKTQKTILLFILSFILIFVGSLICNMYVRISHLDQKLITNTNPTDANLTSYLFHIWCGSLAIVIGTISLGLSVYTVVQTKSVQAAINIDRSTGN